MERDPRKARRGKYRCDLRALADSDLEERPAVGAEHPAAEEPAERPKRPRARRRPKSESPEPAPAE